MHLILTRSLFTDIVSKFEHAPGWDYETNRPDPRDPAARIVGVSMAAPIAGKLVGFYIPLAHQVGYNAEPLIATDIAEYLTKSPIVPFALTTEYLWSATRFKVSPRVIGDGFIAARLLQYEEKGLKDLAQKILGKGEVIRLSDLFPPGETACDFSTLDSQNERVLRYVTDDGLNAYQVEEALRAELFTVKMHGVYDLEITNGMAMAETELHGYRMHTGAVIKAIAKERSRLDQLERNIFVGLQSAPFSLNSPTQLGKALKRLGVQPRLTNKGNESWSVDSLKLIANPPPVVEDVIEWKHTFSVLNGMGRSPLKADDAEKIYPRWLSIAYSGDPDMRSEKPSLTNLPKAARSAFLAPDRTRWIMWAWLQPRMRALAALSDDTALQALLATGYDFYTTLGATLAGKAAGDGTEEDRGYAKKLMHAVVDYCGDPERVAARMGVGLHEAANLIKWVYARFPHAGAYLTSILLNPQPEFSGFMNRRWRLPVDTEWLPSAVISALLRQTVATWLKFTMGRLMANHELGHPMLKGFGQLIPVYDRLFYVLDETVPVPAHFHFILPIVETVVNNTQLRAEYGVGPTWGDITLIPDFQFAQAMADFAASGGSMQ